jgi:hypothetical protein
MEEKEAKVEQEVQREKMEEMVAREGWQGRWACWVVEEARDKSRSPGSRSWW